MIFPGHVAAAWMAGKMLGVDRRAALAVSMFPDLVDKPLRWILRLTPNDRLPAHTGLAWGLSTFIVYLLLKDRAAQGWLVGYGAHLLCDEINAHLNPGRIYFWWPFKRYTLHVGPTGLGSSLNDFRPASLVFEALVVLWALRIAVTERAKG